MEWMLQVVDEVDDTIGAVKHRWLGLRIELGLPRLQGFCIALAAVGAAFAMGLGAAS